MSFSQYSNTGIASGEMRFGTALTSVYLARSVFSDSTRGFGFYLFVIHIFFIALFNRVVKARAGPIAAILPTPLKA